VIRISSKTIAGTLLALSLLWIVNGCSLAGKRSEPPPHDLPLGVQLPSPETPESTYVHVVRWQGETLSSIADWYTASWQNWEALARTNPEIDPKRIKIGDRIQIPEALLKTRKPMPVDFLPSAVSTKAVQPAASPPEPVEKPDRVRALKVGETSDMPKSPPREVELFGPSDAWAQPVVVPEEMELFGPGEITGNPAEIREETGLFGPVE
jgi:hypothetical protein